MISKKFNKKLLISLVGIIVITSCELTISETDSLIIEGESSVFNGVVDPATAIDNMYNNLTGQTGDQANLYALTEVTTDEQLVPTRGTDWGDNGVWRTLHTHQWGSTHPFLLTVWNNKNSAVLRATEVIDPLSKASAEVVAQAKFLRAYNMWIVMDFFGQVPFRNPTDGPDVIPSVMSRAEAYDFIAKDLTEAIAGLPASNAASPTKTRAVKATARFFLAKLKINAKVYKGSYGASDLQDVIDLVDEIEAEGYSLEADYFNVFKGPDFPNRDVIWAVSACTCNRMWNSLHYHQAHPENGGGGWNGFTTLAEFYDKFEGPANDNSINSGQEERRGYIHTLASTNEQNQGFGYGFQVGQMFGWRDGAAVALEDRNGNPLVFTKELPGLVGNNERTGIRLLKYSPNNGAWTSGVVMARFGDAHLMRAEAMLRAGNTGGALSEVNELRALRENTPPLASLSEAELLNERAREVYLEGWRRNDLIRFEAFDDAWEFKPAGDASVNLFPIPSGALLSNPNLTQNAGY